jgi:trehalose 6-phosphate phosphatase
VTDLGTLGVKIAASNWGRLVKWVHGLEIGAPPPVEASTISLFLDLDGTMAPFEDDPARVVATKRRTKVLRELGQTLDGRLALISGRPLCEIDRIAARSVLTVAGLYGLERRSIAGAFTAQAHPGVAKAHEALMHLSAQTPGLLIENKRLSVALHYRRCPELHDRLLPVVAALCQANGLDLLTGYMVFDLKTPGPTKGDAVQAFMSEPPFKGSRPIFIGDDTADEPGFAAARSRGGFGILIGGAAPTQASYRLGCVDDVLDWLENLTLSTVSQPLRRLCLN